MDENGCTIQGRRRNAAPQREEKAAPPKRRKQHHTETRKGMWHPRQGRKARATTTSLELPFLLHCTVINLLQLDSLYLVPIFKLNFKKKRRNHVAKFEGTKHRVSEMRIKCHDGIHIFAVNFWHSQGWSLKNEALMSAMSRRVATLGAFGLSFEMQPWIQPNSQGAIGSKESRLKVEAPPRGSATT